MLGPDLSCQELVELVTDYLEDALAPRERARFELHLAGCSGCPAYLDQMRTTVTLVGATGELEDRPDVSALLGRFREWGRNRSPDLG